MAYTRPVSARHPTDRLVGESPAIQALRAQIRHLAAFDTLGNPEVPTLVLQGETGTGKGLVARIVHDSGPRAHGPFIEVNCAAIPETLLEAELFGFEAGAFTDAKRAKPGLFEAASAGTLLLDEIDTLPLPLQSKLLTVVEAKRVRRVGAVAERRLDVKLIAATAAELNALVSAGRFRPDLYHRLAVVLLALPPLRERRADILVMAQHFLRHYAAAHGLVPKRLSGAAEAWLVRYGWPGNVRELSHLLERVTLLSPEAILAPDTLERLCLPGPRSTVATTPGPGADAPVPVEESARMRQALQETRGNVVRAAHLLGWSRSALRYRLRRYGMARGIGQGEGPSEPGGAVRALAVSEASPAPGSNWEQKPVAVLAIELSWPEALQPEPPRYEPWTAAAHWEQLVAERVRGFGGILVQRAPSLLIAAFGIPQTLEQLPQRAVQAALAIRRLVAEAGAEARGDAAPAVRLAVHSGQLLVDVAASDPTARVLAVGETLALPVRLLGHTAPGDILLSSEVGHLVEGLFKLEARALPRGASQRDEASAYAVLGLWPRRHPLAGLATRPLSRYVGREHELATLHDLLGQVEAGRGQVVGIVGEPGMGKSRLLYELRQGLAARPLTYLEGCCLSYGSATPYLPVLDLLWDNCGITEADSPEAISEKVRTALQEVEMDPQAQAPYLLQLLGVKAGTERLAALSAQAIQARTFETFYQMCLNSSRRRPLVIAIEDLQWIDKTSEDFLASLVESLARAPILFLSTYRPGYRPLWIDKSYVTQLTLQPLSPQDSQRVVQPVFQTAQIPAPLAQAILAKAEGNPFFLEELARAVIERGDLRSTAALPDTIRGVLMARIDRLPNELKRVLQTAAVLGRAVSPRLLDAMWAGPSIPEPSLQELKRLEFLYEHTEAGESIYVFKHTLTQEVAYEGLAHSRRQALHAAAGRALEALYTDRLEEVYDRLAYHYSKTAEADKAVAYLSCLAEKAARSYAHVEAVKALQEAVIHVEHLPGKEQDRRLLELLLRQASSLSILGRFGEILDVLLAQRECLERIDDPLFAGRYYFRLGLTFSYQGEQEQATLHAQRALAEATRCGDRATMGMAHYVMGLKSAWSGQPRAGVEHSRQAVELLKHTEERHWLGMAHWLLGLNHFFLGEFEPALAAEAHVEPIGEAMGDPRLRGFAAWTSGWIYATRGDAEEGIKQCQAALAYAADPLNATAALGQLGYAYLESGDLAQAIALLEQAVQQVDRFRLRQLAGRFKTLLSEAYLLKGDLAKARELAIEGLAMTQEIKHAYVVGLAQRGLGRIDRASGALVEAEHHLHEALQTFASSQAQFEVGRTYLDLAVAAHAREDRDTVTACLVEAQHLFRTLQVPKYMERAVQMATACGVLLA